MLNNSASVFRCVAIGTAAENKEIKSKKLIVTPIEKLPFMDGEMVDRVDAIEYEGVDAEGKATAGKSFVSNNIEAIWLPETNRRTPPDVQRGEHVEIYQYANNDKYYWRSSGLDDKLRRLETIVIGISANPGMDVDGVDPENMYFFEISSHKKMFTFSTSQKNGELCKYNFQFNMSSGKVILEDNIGNYAQLDSLGFLWELKNAMGTVIRLNKQDIYGFAPRNIFLKAGANVDVKANKITLDGGGSVFTLEASGTTLKTPKFAGST